MLRASVCHYYQAGHCRSGDVCTYIHPTVKCRSFSSTGWCPYGYNCHFWHDHSNRSDSPVVLVRKPCTFFANDQCKYGEQCAFSHDLDDVNNISSEARTLAEFRATTKLAKLTLQPSTVSTENRRLRRNSLKSTLRDNSQPGQSVTTPVRGDYDVSRSRPIYSRPEEDSTKLRFNGMTRTEYCRLQHLEVARLVKTYSVEKLREADSDETGRTFFLRFSSTDPDWAYRVREITLRIHIGRFYPSEHLEITVLPEDPLSDVLIEHLNMSIASWIGYKHGQMLRQNRTELYLQPFFRWLDRNMEHMFTEGLRKFKALLTATQHTAASTISPFSTDNTDDDDDVSDNSLPQRFDRDPSLVSKMNTPPRLSASSHSIANAVVGSQTISDDQVPSDNDPDNLNDLDVDSEQPVLFGEDVKEYGEWFDPVIPKLTSNLSDLEAAAASKPTVSTTHLPGTQRLSLEGLRLRGKTGTLTVKRLCVTLHCTRCRLSFAWVFRLHGNQRPSELPPSGSSMDLPTMSPALRSVPPHTANCARCKQSMDLLFIGRMAHAFEHCLGVLHLNGCIADDVPSKTSEVSLLCTGCNRQVKVAGFEPGHPMNKHCLGCHSSVGIEFSLYRLELMQTNGAIPLSNSIRSAKTNSTDSYDTGLSRKKRRALNNPHNPLIQDGLPLPDHGTCKHYKKSYRWLRFPCCGRLEACDVCHDEHATDGHEMQMAGRMVCGFCSREQTFSSSKPCVRCGKSLSGSRSSAHWEGGKGCRNRVAMSRKDDKKYAQMNKTIPKKQS